ncbi:MAG: RNA polymerase factor sigma-54 [Leadbetterella sp.]|nr:RNA polymerase factor sigma-54 [Leadbetterella sp.]
MQKLILNQSLQQRLSPQQIQFIKLLQIPTVELAQRIEEELEINPALEEGKNMEQEKYSSGGEDSYSEDSDNHQSIDTYSLDDFNLKDYRGDNDDYGGYKMSDSYQDEARDVMPVVSVDSLQESLMQQLGFLQLNDRQTVIGKQLIGSIEDDGYLRRPLRSICNDLAFSQNIYTNEEEVEGVLRKIQKFEPAGIGARDLQECLILQIEKKANSVENNLALTVLEDYFDEFSKKHFDKIQKKLGVDDETLKSVFQLITRLNPKPGNMISTSHNVAYLMADFIVSFVNGKMEIILNSKNAPDLRISKSFSDMLDTYSRGDKQNKQIKETVTFVKQKLDAAKWFIDAIKQRQQTLLKTMEAIVDFQYSFFVEGDESKLRPMILKDIADKIDMDISTVSRVANSKSVQTDFGIYPLKYFFSEGIATESGEDASSREVKNILKALIDEEGKTSPYSDDKLEKLLKAKGYNIARRTVAKYREQLGIPVARLRKEI